MTKNKGVKIYLVPRTRIPKWIKMQNLSVSVEKKKIDRGRVRILTIKGGKAAFYPGGGVGVIMPGSNQFWTAFASLKVLKIEDLEGREIVSNHFLCQRCFTNTGKMIGEPRETEILGRYDADFQCSVCRHKWTRRI